MSRFAKLPSVLPVDTTRYTTNTASNITASQPVITTIDATTAFVVDLGVHVAQISLQLRAASGAVQGGLVHVSVNSGAATLANNAFTVTTGALYVPNNGATNPDAYAVDALTNATGRLVLKVEFAAAAANAKFIVTYGTYQLIVAKAIA